MRIGSGPKQSLRLVLQSSMKRPWILATTKVETSKHLVIVVKRAVRQNVRLDAAKDPEILAEALC
ncbi:hypothetical protein XI04_27270 [Bradyrhizobium sp. CCBAU 11430]|nr:hypothetical protein [Bradyrhizobium sp. CCBAU 25360]MDA9516718.1 hypothetical protein [Bradyrhizobium sp. CCBAU 11430]